MQRDGGAITGAIDGAIAPNAPAWLRAWVQRNFRRMLLVPSREEKISSLGQAWALRYSITLGARCWCHLERISEVLALRYSITSGARC